jgi:hypothetical protein
MCQLNASRLQTRWILGLLVLVSVLAGGLGVHLLIWREMGAPGPDSRTWDSTNLISHCIVSSGPRGIPRARIGTRGTRHGEKMNSMAPGPPGSLTVACFAEICQLSPQSFDNLWMCLRYIR